LFAAICLIKAIVSDESFGFLTRVFDLCFRLDKGEGLLPGPNHTGEKYQEQPVSLPIDGSFHLSMQGDQLVPQQGVFRQ
jgi:hypothetical protein